MRTILMCAAAGVVLVLPRVGAGPDDERKTVADLDTRYQAAVKHHDAATMDRILADDFILVTGKGVVHTKAELLAEARSPDVVYERQEDQGKSFDYRLWFSDTYVRTRGGWRYVFGQASIPLPASP